MPYRWTDVSETTRELRLWPHNSLPPTGFATTVLGLFALTMIPVLVLLGSGLLWGILPFALCMIAGVWWALQVNYRQRRILEVLTLSGTLVRLVRHDPNGGTRKWECNRHWARPELHETGGPVPNYVTLTGAGRAVEIGAFLSEDERQALFRELARQLPRHAA